MAENERQRPQFGEYATPDQQRDAIKVPLDDHESIPVESHVSPTSHISVQGTPHTSAPAAGASKPSAGDRFATIALLGIGLITVLMTIPALTNLPPAITSAFAQLDVGEYTSDGLAHSLGVGALVTEIVLWIVAAWLSTRALRKGKRAWWIPVVFGVVANIVVFGAITVAMTVDPAFTEYVNRMSSGG
ncbi:DUF6264 family protein [Mycetocola zhadangensis]|uniref:Uncharacterized protein n=1 Tax=Mycetocola zhadangensis TaxID=1164595 RepID=A0A3L7J5E2_9MICO|nr:DUF6264 family protein [Mycetocola zhadangensis]RLQ85669.1 hypothetical protein D9V28_01985 [Mycetocola zhadangensis]GGE84644.1 hypothetical protein GCM10011313_03920 [Mycetocola zhadangensis]